MPRSSPAIVLALYHLPAGPLKIAAVTWSFLVYGTVLMSRRFELPVFPAWALHGMHNATFFAINLAMR
jgi:hypothetical protein